MISSGFDAKVLFSIPSIIQFFEALREFDFLRQSLFINLITGVVTAPLGVLLLLRRMSLMGDALSHALLPGVAASYFFFGLSVPAMTLGGFLAGTAIVLLTAFAQKHSPLKEESNFAAFYLLSLSLGVLTISLKGNSVDLMHILFGSSLTATSENLTVTFIVCLIVGVVFAVYRRYFILEIFDPIFLQSKGKKTIHYQTIFLILVVACLVVSFQTNGTLLAMGQLILPSIIGRLWSQDVGTISIIAIINSMAGSALGLYISYQLDWPLGPSTLLTWGFIYLLSLVLNPNRGLIRSILHPKHFEH